MNGPHSVSADRASTHVGITSALPYPRTAITAEPQILAKRYVKDHTAKMRNGEPSCGCSACKAIWHDQAETIATIFHSPSARNRKPPTVLFAQVVRMRVTILREIINPDQCTTVLIGQRHRRIFFAHRTGTLTSHVVKPNSYGI